MDPSNHYRKGDRVWYRRSYFARGKATVVKVVPQREIAGQVHVPYCLVETDERGWRVRVELHDLEPLNALELLAEHDLQDR